MPKTICKTTDKDSVVKKQQNPKFICKKCKNEAAKEKHLCKPEKK